MPVTAAVYERGPVKASFASDGILKLVVPAGCKPAAVTVVGRESGGKEIDVIDQAGTDYTATAGTAVVGLSALNPGVYTIGVTWADGAKMSGGKFVEMNPATEDLRTIPVYGLSGGWRDPSPLKSDLSGPNLAGAKVDNLPRYAPKSTYSFTITVVA